MTRAQYNQLRRPLGDMEWCAQGTLMQTNTKCPACGNNVYRRAGCYGKCIGCDWAVLGM